MNATALELTVLNGSTVVARQTFDQTKIIIGRILSADFRVADASVSRIHALLERLDDGGLRLTDLASSHGSFVNGERIVERMIGAADEVKLAALTLKITVVAEQPKVEPKVNSPYATASAASNVRRPKEASRAEMPSPKQSKEPSLAEPRLSAGGGIEIVPSGPREVTAIRSLKETARTRGVLDPSGGMNDELEMTVYWQETILTVDHYKKTKDVRITIGTGEKNTYIVGSTSIPDHFEFVRVHGNTADISLHNSMKGSVRTQGKMQTVEDLLRSGRSTLSLSGQDIAKIQVDQVNFFIMFVPEPPAIPRGVFFDQGGLYWGMQAAVAVAAVLFLTLASIFRSPIEGNVKEFPENLRKIIIEEFKKKKEVPPPVVAAPPPPPPVVKAPPPPTPPPPAAKKAAVAQAAKQGGNEGEGMREKGTEGKRGKPNAANETGIQNRPKVSASRTVHDAPVRAKNDGIISALRNTGLGTKLAKVSGMENGAQGNDPLDKAFAGVGGNAIQDGRGAGGSGLKGTGTGGGGTATGVGGLGSKGFGGGASGNGIGSIPGKGDFAVGTEATSVTVVGGLSREEIRRVVDAHQSEIRFCYQRELQRDPRLFGKVTVKWKIISGGAVSSAAIAENSTGSAALANCIKDKVTEWKFPSPPAASEGVNVEWPWIFKPSGG